MNARATCRSQDRDCPSLVCGYPLPCPHHTVTIHAGKSPPTVEIPATSSAGLRAAGKLQTIAAALGDARKDGES